MSDDGRATPAKAEESRLLAAAGRANFELARGDGHPFTLVGRAMRRVQIGESVKVFPSVIVVRRGEVYDVTETFPTMAELCDRSDPATAARSAAGVSLGDVSGLMLDSDWRRGDASSMDQPHALASPIDLQAIKACGVTFVTSMLERLIEEQAHGDRSREQEFRSEIESVIGDALSAIVPGSDAAADVAKRLKDRGLWSQYLEVGIGPDAEVFTKAPVMSSRGFGEELGLSPWSEWITTEPELVVICRPNGQIVGVTLGNDVTLRDWEGRSALLLGRAKDFAGSCSLGPWMLVSDARDVGDLVEEITSKPIEVEIVGRDGCQVTHATELSELSRPVNELVDQASGPLHYYPDGFALFLGTVFAPTVDRGGDGLPFSHHEFDVVSIHHPMIGTLVNRFRNALGLLPWENGIRYLFERIRTRTDLQSEPPFQEG